MSTITDSSIDSILSFELQTMLVLWFLMGYV